MLIFLESWAVNDKKKTFPIGKETRTYLIYYIVCTSLRAISSDAEKTWDLRSTNAIHFEMASLANALISPSCLFAFLLNAQSISTFHLRQWIYVSRTIELVLDNCLALWIYVSRAMELVLDNCLVCEYVF